MRKFFYFLFLIMTGLMIMSCSSKKISEEVSVEESNNKIKVGVSMPTKDVKYWSICGDYLKKQLETMGYQVDLQYAKNDIATQNSQIEKMISDGSKTLIVAPIDGNLLGDVLISAKGSGIPVIAYDKLLMNSDAVTYYVTFDNYLIGKMQGEYIRNNFDFDNATEPFYMEIFAGDIKDNDSTYLYNGAMDVLNSYIDEGKIVIPSGQREINAVTTLNWDTETAQNRMSDIISSYYANGEKLDMVLCSNDSIALGVGNALENNYLGEYPLITGKDCDIANVKRLIKGKQAMSVFRDGKMLADQVVKMVKAIDEGLEPEINDRATYDNGARIIPTYICAPLVVTDDNYKEILIDSGYLSEKEIK